MSKREEMLRAVTKCSQCGERLDTAYERLNVQVAKNNALLTDVADQLLAENQRLREALKTCGYHAVAMLEPNDPYERLEAINRIVLSCLEGER